jgi:hypothetical protein
VFDKTTSDSECGTTREAAWQLNRGARMYHLLGGGASQHSCGAERPLALLVSVLPSCVICVGVHNWTDLRREKLHAAGMNHDRTEETVIEVCCLLDEQISLLNSQNQDY